MGPWSREQIQRYWEISIFHIMFVNGRPRFKNLYDNFPKYLNLHTFYLMIIQFDQYLVDEVDIISMNNESIKI